MREQRLHGRVSNFVGAFINTTEMYLWTIYELEEQGIVGPQRALIWRRLGISRSAVHQQVARMAQDGLVSICRQNRVLLTPSGRAVATVVMRKHRLAERILVDIIGLDWELSHAEAIRWQHVLGEAVERKLLHILDNPATSPFGIPIPALGALDPSCGRLRAGPAGSTLVSLTQAAREQARTATIRRIPEHVQDDHDVLAALRAACVVPGQAVRISRSGPADSGVRVATEGGYVVVGQAASDAIQVSLAECGA